MPNSIGAPKAKLSSAAPCTVSLLILQSFDRPGLAPAVAQLQAAACTTRLLIVSTITQTEIRRLFAEGCYEQKSARMSHVSKNFMLIQGCSRIL